MKYINLIGYAALAVGLMIVFGSLAIYSNKPEPFIPRLISLTNTERASPLSESTELDEHAQMRAMYLCSNPFNHENWKDFIATSSFYFIGENLAKNYGTDAEATYAGLYASPDHKENMLDTNFTNMGVAHIECLKNQYGTNDVTVELFGGYER